MHLDNFEKNFSAKVLEKGRSLYRQHKFSVLEQDEDDPAEWYAVIEGSQDDYELFATVQPTGEITDYECDCPYDWGGPCKHLAALFFELRDRIGKSSVKLNIISEKAAQMTSEEMLQAYLTLDETSKKLLKIAAVLWEAASKTKLGEIFNTANLKHEGKNLYPNELNPRLENLVKAGLLQLDGNTQYRTPEVLSNALCNRYFDSDPDFKKVVPTIRSLAKFSTYWYGMADPDRCFREMRIGRYLNDFSSFQTGFSVLL